MNALNDAPCFAPLESGDTKGHLKHGLKRFKRLKGTRPSNP
jgi:hypothetical protein